MPHKPQRPNLPGRPPRWPDRKRKFPPGCAILLFARLQPERSLTVSCHREKGRGGDSRIQAPKIREGAWSRDRWPKAQHRATGRVHDCGPGNRAVHNNEEPNAYPEPGFPQTEVDATPASRRACHPAEDIDAAPVDPKASEKSN